MSRINASRRNRALRKIRACRQLPPEITLTLEAILDNLNSQSGYCLAWPSAAALAKQMGKSRRTILWHLKAIKQFGIFHVRQFAPEEAKVYATNKYGLNINLDRCRHQAPNLFEVNPDHPLWDASQRVPREIEDEWSRIVKQMCESRNAKTTSRLSTHVARRLEVDLALCGEHPNGKVRPLPNTPPSGSRRF